MKPYFIFLAVALSVAACANNQPVVQKNANTTAPANGSERPQTVTAHSTENLAGRPAASNSSAPGAGKWSASGEPIDTAKFDGTIAAAQKTVESKPTDEAAKKNLAQAYFDRGFALTEARQYAAALGDYRKALKYDPGHEEAKKWQGQIVSIYGMLKKEAPKEGEEPAALPFKKS